MIKVKKEDIDKLIYDSFVKTNSCDKLLSLARNIELFLPMIKVLGLDANNSNIAVYCLACIQTAQEISINTVRDVLYKLCCEDDETENTNEASEMTGDK